MDSQVEASLLVKRFADLTTVEDLGRLIKDFFCARNVDSGTYGGRLFIMEKTLVFVSAYSNSKSYDCCISLSDVTMATAFQRGIIPSLEIDWKDGKESFTNIYDIKAIEKTLREVLPVGKVAVRRADFNRMSSVPSKVPPGLLQTSASTRHAPKAEPCHFFSKCGYCPRRVVCRLDHTLQTRPTSSDADKTTPKAASDVNSSPSHHQAYQRSPLKKVHLEGSTESGGEIANEAVMAPLPPGVVKVTTHRSYSSPASMELLRNRDATQGRNGIENPKELRSNTAPVNTTLDSGAGSQALPPFQPFSKDLSRDLPQSFEFSSQVSHNTSSMSSVSDEFHTPEGGSPPQDDRGGLFVFSGSSPFLQCKRRNATQALTPPPNVLPQEGAGFVRSDEATSREVAMLTQQLDLDSDDEGSLQGDLDIETQLRIMQSFSHDNKLEIPEAPPPYSSVVPYPPDSAPEEATEGRGQKRQPCSYFLSGYCRNGMECPDYHGVDPDMEYENMSEVNIPSSIQVHSGATIKRADINSGDKIILPPHILIACEQQQLSYPMAFKMESTVSGRFVYGGVLQFTSPSPNSAYLPQWMMEHLQVQEGDEVSFKHVDLPKGQFVRLQPVSSSWLAIPYDKRMAVMEFQLRNFQTLTEGTKVTLNYELNKYTLKVLVCQPAQGISIVDSDLTTDIIEPADLQRFHSVEEGQAENIGLDDVKSCDAAANAYRHFVLLSLPGKPLPSKLRVEVESSKGDADLFLSQSFATPTQSRYTWCNQEVGKSVIRLNAEDEKSYDIHKPLYAGVMAAFEKADFTISFHREDTTTAGEATPSPAPSGIGQTLRGGGVISTASATDESESESPLPPGHQQCSYCGSVMPALRLLMHERHCLQSTFKCPLCKLCMPKTTERKHTSISHQLLVCECGEEHTQLALHRHQELDCTKRMHQCQFKWCNLSFPMDQLSSHESICGRKMVDCPVCNEEVSQLEMEMHLEAFHSVKTESIDWGKPLNSQTLLFNTAEPKFKCPCGLGFQFQDDLQVHQLTECTFRRMAEDEVLGDGAGLLRAEMAADIVG